MADQLSLRGGTTAEHATFTGANKEVTVDTTKKTLVVNDGATVGGHPLMRENASNSALALGSAATPSLKFTGDTNTGIYSPGADQVAVATNGTGRLFIDASGRVGVGISPGNTLHVNGTSRFEDYLYGTTANGILYVNDDLSVTAGRKFYLDSGSNTYVHEVSSDVIAVVTGSNERLRITSAGLVGVGTSSPGQGQAQINTTAAGASDINAIALNLTNNSTAAGTGVSLRFSPGNVLTALRGSYINSLISGANGSDLQFWTCGDGVVPGERMRIDSSGNVGIGTSSPQDALHIAVASAVLRLEDTDTNCISTIQGTAAGLVLSADATNSTASSFLGLSVDGTERARIDSSGRLLIGTSSDAQTSTVTVQGNSASTTGGAIVRMRIGTATPADGNTTGVIKLGSSSPLL
jgi:hypothetical protein